MNQWVLVKVLILNITSGCCSCNACLLPCCQSSRRNWLVMNNYYNFLDLNPVGAVSKISQIVFAFIVPGNLFANVVAGGITAAGAEQACDLIQDLKIGHLLRASPRAQFYGQLIGSFFSIFFGVSAYMLYSSAYDIPGTQFPVPTAEIWVGMAKLMNGGTLAVNVGWFCLAFGLFGGILPLIIIFFPKATNYLPSGVAFAVFSSDTSIEIAGSFPCYS
jgi:uncharacterized oligopeptide transporter (OPT) family protein